MATRNETHVHDLSTLANFKDWAKAISDALTAFGWIQCDDTGQVVWTATVLTLTDIAVGVAAVYSYSSFTGPAPRIGMSVIITGFATGGNNVTATLTAVSGGASGTVTVALTTQVNETHAASGTTTALAAAPTSNVYVYEVWKPGDALTTFNLRIDYGNNGGVSPALKMNIGTTTNGAGTLSGTTMVQMIPNTQGNSGSTLFNCLFCGDTSSFGMMLWRDANAAFNVGFGIDRSRDATGAATSTYITMLCTGQSNGNANNAPSQQSLLFGVGVTQIQGGNQFGNIEGLSWVTLNGIGTAAASSAASTTALGGNIPILPVFPVIGYVDNPVLIFAVGAIADYTELAVITSTIYGATHTFIYSKNQKFSPGMNLGLLMRWE